MISRVSLFHLSGDLSIGASVPLTAEPVASMVCGTKEWVHVQSILAGGGVRTGAHGLSGPGSRPRFQHPQWFCR